MLFECDPDKEAANLAKHGVDFSAVELVFRDPRRIIKKDKKHSTDEENRFYAVGHDGKGVLTVRFTWRSGRARIIGAGYWRKQKKDYENQK